MYGMEKGKDDKKFMFDLELELIEHPKRSKELLDKAESRIHEIKSIHQLFDRLGHPDGDANGNLKYRVAYSMSAHQCEH